MFHAIPYAEEFAVRKRALDVALKGYSDVKQPKRASTAIPLSIRSASFKSNSRSSLQLISKTIEEQMHILEGLDESIHTEVLLAKSLLAEHGDGINHPNDMPVVLKAALLNTMKAIKLHQREYVRVLRVMEGIKVIEIAMLDGFLDPRKVAKCLNEILKVTWKSRAHSQTQKVVTPDDKLLNQLRAKEFFPYLKSKHPGMVFFRGEKPKSPEELLVASSNSRGGSGESGTASSTADSNSMPALSSIGSSSVVSASVYGDSQMSASVFGDSQYSYAPSEVSSAPNSPTEGSSRNNKKHFIGFSDHQRNIIPDFYSRDTLIPALALQYPETIILDVLEPTLEIVPKNRPSRWGSEGSGSGSGSEPQQPISRSLPNDSTISYLRDSLPTRPPSFAKRCDSFSTDGDSLIGMEDMFLSSLDSIPNVPARRGSGDSQCIKEEENEG